MKSLAAGLQRIADGFDGRVGIGVRSRTGFVTIRAGERFSLQSVMKLIVAATVMDAVDRRGWNLREPVLVRRDDLSLNVQPIADLVGKNGYRTNIADLLSRAVNDSDSAATDILFARVGGTATIAAFLNRVGVASRVRVDRDERHLQTETVGLTWRPEYVDATILERAEKAVPAAKRDAAYEAYRKDIRDTATPDGMAAFVFATGQMLSPASTRYLLMVMWQTRTGLDGLRAGLSKGWTLGNKTGTSGSHRRLTAATNDVGVLTAPDGHRIAVAVFVADSRRSDKDRSALIAEVARAVITDYQGFS